MSLPGLPTKIESSGLTGMQSIQLVNFDFDALRTRLQKIPSHRACNNVSCLVLLNLLPLNSNWMLLILKAPRLR